MGSGYTSPTPGVKVQRCCLPTRQPSATSSDAPLIRVSGFAVIAGVVEDTLGERRKLLGQ